jgi:hypothetical protein
MSKFHTSVHGSEHANVSTTIPGNSKASAFRFLDLPAEVRGLVYPFIFQGTNLKHIGRYPDLGNRDARGRRLMGTGSPLRWDAEDRCVVGAESSLWSPAIAIIFVSKLCYQEAKPVLLSEATFYLDMQQPPHSTRALTSASLVLSPVELSTVRHVNIVTETWIRGSQHLPDLLDSLPSLETAVLYCDGVPGIEATVPDLDLDKDGVLKTEKLELIQSNIEETIRSATLCYGCRANAPANSEHLNTFIRSWDAGNRSFEPILVLKLRCEQDTTPDGKRQDGFWYFVSGCFGNQHPVSQN